MYLELFTTRMARLYGSQMSILTGPSCHRSLCHLRFIFHRTLRTKSAVSVRSLRPTAPEVHSEIEMGASAMRFGHCLFDATCLCRRREHDLAQNRRSREFVFNSNPGNRGCDSVHCGPRASTQA